MLMFSSSKITRRQLKLLVIFCTQLLFTGCQSSGITHESENTSDRFPAESSGYKAGISSIFEGNAVAQFEAANTALEAGQNDVARTLLLKLTSESPELSSPWVNLGVAYQNLGADEKALQAFQRALVSQPGNCEALNRLGIMARQAGDFESAEAKYLACLESTPEFSEVHLNLGILYELYMGKYASALSQYHSYVAGLNEPDRRVGGWIKDLERRRSSMLATENY